MTNKDNFKAVFMEDWLVEEANLIIKAIDADGNRNFMDVFKIYHALTTAFLYAYLKQEKWDSFLQSSKASAEMMFYQDAQTPTETKQ